MERSKVIGKLTGVIFLLCFAGYNAYSQGTEVPFSSIPKSGTILVNSHMDDDLIWMLPFWELTEKFICGAMPPSPGFRNIISDQQDFMDSHNYNIPYEQNWFTPWGDVSNQEYVRYYLEADPAYNYLLNDHLETRLYNNPTPLSRFELNKIKAKLEQYFADPSMSRVITHNNWGEYGHQHHIGLNRAVRELAVKYRKDVWMLGCDNGAFIDVSVPNGITWAYGSFDDPILYVGARTAYVNNGLWTWSATTVPSGNHKFIRIVEGGSDKSYILKGDEITYPGAAQSEPGSYIFDGDDDYLTLRGNNHTSFTIMMRVRPEMIREMDIAAMSEYPTSTKNDRNLYLTSDGYVNARIFDGSSKILTSATQLTAQAWNHVAITVSGSEFRLYVNGLLNRSITTGDAITDYSTPELILGLATMTSTNFSGQINDVRMINRVMSENEIALASGMVYTITSSAGTGGTITPAGNTSAQILTNSTFSITPSTGYHISDVLVDNVSVGPVGTYTFLSVTANHTISATFAQSASHIVTTSAGAGGSINPSGNVTVYEGTSQVFAIVPATGFKIIDVLVDGLSAGPVSSYTFTNITGDHTISATFDVTPTHTITASAGTGGSISPSGELIVNETQDYTFTITPLSGFRITDVIADGTSVGQVTSYTFVNVMTNHTISATFERIRYSISASAGDGGSVSPEGTTLVNHGSDQTYTFQPQTGYRIASVRIDGIPVGNPSEYTFENVTSNHTVSVTYAIIINTITATAEAGGSISPSGNISVEYGDDRTFTVSTNEGYHLSDVVVDGSSRGAVSSYTFHNVTTNHTITAEFTPITYTITATAGTGGRIIPSGGEIVNYGTNRIFTFSPDHGFQISNVIVDGVSVGVISSYTFTNVTEDHTISVSFSVATYIIQAVAGTGGMITPSGTLTINHGSDQAYTIAPSTGYRITEVRVDNSTVGTVNSFTFNDVEEDHTIYVDFELITFNIASSAGQGGSISPSGNISVTYGSSRTFSIVPNTGYTITEVLADNVSAGPVPTYTFSNITSDHTISATFTANRYTITTSAGPGGTVSPSGINTVTHGSSLSVSINPVIGYRISRILIDNIPAGTVSNYTFTDISTSHTLAATFERITYNITANSGSGGSIDPAGTTVADYGSSLTYQIIPATGFKIAGVSIDGVANGPVNSYTFSNILSNHAISATFTIKTYSVSVTCNTGGKVSPQGINVVNHGSDLDLVFTPDEGYRVGDIKIDGISVGRMTAYDLTDITGDHNVTVTFEPIPNYSIDASSGIGGEISPSGSVTLPEGSEIFYSITPETGYRILDVKVDGVSVGAVTEYQFDDLLSNHEIRAEFTTTIEVKAYPNPFPDDLKVFIATPGDEEFQISVSDSGGRIIYLQDAVQGNTEIPVSLTGGEGLCFLRVYKGSKKIAVIKLVNSR